MITEQTDRDRVKCPFCRAFLMEVRPRLNVGQIVVCYCSKCHKEVKIAKG